MEPAAHLQWRQPAKRTQDLDDGPDGVVAVETEHRTDDTDGSFVIRNRDEGFAGEGYVQSVETKETEPAPAGASTGWTYTVAVEAADYTLGLVVREVPRPVTLPLSQIEPAPEFVQDSGTHDKYLEGIAKLPDGGIIIVLDMRKLLSPSEVMRLPGKVASS